jgi:hypothetical protein
MTKIFKEAVCWFFHGESEETIREDLRFEGDLDEVKKVASDMKAQGLDFEDVYEWSKE